MTNRRIEYLPLSSLKPHPRNPKTHDLAALKKSIQRFGFNDAVIIDERTQQLVSGHGRVDALRALHTENAQQHPAAVRVKGEGPSPEWLVPVQRGWSSRDDTEAEAFIIAANRLVETGGYDDRALEAVLRDLAAASALDGVGYSLDEVDKLLAEAAARDFKPQTDADAVPESAPARTHRGDVWQLGAHRLMCGDSTSAADVDKLLAGAKLDLVFTDPPYGLGTDATTGKNAYDVFIDTREAVASLVKCFMPIAQRVAPLVIITSGTASMWLYPEPTWVLAWYTPASTGRGPWGFCTWQPVLAFGKDPLLGSGRGSHPDFVQTKGIERLKNSIHPCPKPADSWQALLERVSLEGARFLDFFCGSGTSIVVAERSGRTCFAMELSPAYVDLAVARWEAFTGKTAVKL